MTTDRKQGGQGNSGAAGGSKKTNTGHGIQSDQKKQGDGKKGTEGHGGGQGTGAGN
jgi:hypothetical protein